MPYLVLKPIPVNDGVIASGEVVDAENWRNLRTLISGRYLSPDPVPAKAAAKQSSAANIEVEDAPAPAPASAPVKAARPKRPTTPSTSEE